ncbi:MAG: tetratricopeptide repeat protein, partial [Myxococcota bacterium]
VSLVRREYLRQRRGRNQYYDRQIRVEEGLVNEARATAIREFERFVATYPNDPTYTPDAMFRLGELYFERSATQFQEQYDAAQEQIDAGNEDVELPEQADFTPTIELYQRLIDNFPNYRRRDGVLYLIGYCLNELGRYAEALEAWHNLVCANRFTYDPQGFAARQAAEAQAMAEADAAAEADDTSPALDLVNEGEEEEPAPDLGFQDPYVGCRPVMEDAEFVTETWFRVGEYHFDDYGAEFALEKAISAYNQILQFPEDRNYNLALYKVAWAYYRASRYPEAIQAFGSLVQWSDDQRARTGEAGSQLRPEAIQYLGIAFAYDDWNENGLPDNIEDGATGIERVQNPELLPQDRGWTAEVFFQLGQVYFEEAKYAEAIEVWRLALERYPNSPQAPHITSMIGQAYQRAQDFDAARGITSELATYGEGTEWWNNNMDHPAEQREAERLAQDALIATAFNEHETAQRERRNCVELLRAGDGAAAERCAQASANYANAATAYRQYLDSYPNNPQAYELQYNLADALYWSENYEQAAVEYAAVRDSNLDDAHLAESARRVVESLTRIVEAAENRGEFQTRDTAPEPSGEPPQVRPVEMPQLVQRLAQARELYGARVTEAQDSENVRAAYEYNNALLLYWYGYWPQAKERFASIFEERCAGPTANQTGRIAWENLLAMAIAEQDDDESERLARALSERQCTFDPSGEACPSDEELRTFCAQPENGESNCCRADVILTAIEFRRGVQLFDEAEAMQPGPEQTRTYEQSASTLLGAVNEHPGNPQAPIALEKVAIALERTQRFDSARNIYQRIIDEVGPRTGETDEERASLDAIVANAYFRVGITARRGFEFDEAVTNYRVLIDNARFVRSSDERIQTFRQDALNNTAFLLEQLQRYPEAIRYYREIISSNAPADTKRVAAYRIAEIAFKRENWNLAIREMRGFISRYRGQSGAGELVVQAHWRIAQARQNLRQRRDYRTALQDTVRAFAQSGEARGSIAAEYAAHAAFQLTDEEMSQFEQFEIDPGRPRYLEDYIQSLTDQIQAGARRANETKGRLDAVLEYGRPTWTIATLVRQGRIYEVLAGRVLEAGDNVPFVLPREVADQLRGQRLNADTREDLRLRIADSVQQVLDAETRPIECLAVARYALASRAARAGNIDDEYTQQAIDRLQAYGDERIAECIAEAQARDSQFQAYTPGEFARALRGQTLEIEADVAPPSLETR